MQRNESNDDQIADLTAAVENLAEQVEVLRNVLDEIRDDLQYAIRNGQFRGELPSPMMLRVMPADPLDPEWAQKLAALNRRPPESSRDSAAQYDHAGDNESSQAKGESSADVAASANDDESDAVAGAEPGSSPPGWLF